MEIKIDCRSRDKRLYIQALLISILAQLNINRSKKNVYIDVSANQENGAQDIGFGIVVTLNSRLSAQELGRALCHEFVHVKQLALGTLKYAENGGFFWKSKHYPPTTHYLNSPWELQAFGLEEIIFRRALES